MNQLGPIVEPSGAVIYAQGMNGAEAYDYVDGKYASQVREALRLYGSALQAVFISGGGNDFAGFNDLRPLLKIDCSGLPSASCFKDEAVEALFDRIDAEYRRLIGQIYTHTSTDCTIILHTYDHAVPNGQGLIGHHGAWLLPALQDAKVDPLQQAACVRSLVDRFAATLGEICNTDPQHLLLVDTRGTLKDGGWANELHPTPQGFKALAECWTPALRQARLAA